MRRYEIEVPAAAGVAEAYLVRPDGPGPYPGLLMFMDVFGLRPRLREMADRVAARGYAVLLPNLFYRGARSPLVDPAELWDTGKRTAAFRRLAPMMPALAAGVAEDTASYLDFLAAQEGVARGRFGLFGYCMGGRNALIAASALPERVALLASFHAGGVVTSAPDSPHLRAGALTGEIYFGHADRDRSMTRDQIRTLESVLDRAGVTYTSELYEGAPHGFTMTDTATYHPEGERRHWAALFALLDRALPAPVS